MSLQRVRALGALLFALGSATAQTAAPSNAGLQPQRVTMGNGQTAYFQLAEGDPAGTLVLLHGCGPGARSFFPNDPVACPECHDLPEYVAQTKQALARGYHVLALQASHGSNCYSSTTRGEFVDDRPHIVGTTADFLRNHSAQGLPLYVQGYSSGGTLLLKLPEYLNQEGLDLKIDGIVSVDAAPRGGFNAADKSGKLKRGLAFPPTLFVTMERGGAAQRAPEQVRFLQDNSVAAALIKVPPRPVGPTWFSDRISGISPQQSQELVAALTQLGALNATGYVTNVWSVDQAATQLPWLAADQRLKDGVFTELKIAAGDHENMGEFTTTALAWLEFGGKADIDELAKELVPAQLSQLTAERQTAGAAAPAPAR